MIFNYFKALFVTIFMFGIAIASETPATNSDTDKTVTGSGNDKLVGNFEAGQERYKQSCINCHGAAGKGVASYPKISGQEVSYTIEKLETYRNGIKIGPNSSLMIMMAKPLTDEDIANLATYLKDAES
jgi:cytochrome c553